MYQQTSLPPEVVLPQVAGFLHRVIVSLPAESAHAVAESVGPAGNEPGVPGNHCELVVLAFRRCVPARQAARDLGWH